MCTFAPCSRSLFDNREDWFKHELQSHRRIWHCLSCTGFETFQSAELLKEHVLGAHFSSVDIGFNLDSLVNACSRPVSTVPAKVACPFCYEYTQMSDDQTVEKSVVAVAEVKRHLAIHMENLALLSITTLTQDAAEPKPQVSGRITPALSETDADSLLQSEASSETFENSIGRRPWGASDETETKQSDVHAKGPKIRILGDRNIANRSPERGQEKSAFDKAAGILTSQTIFTDSKRAKTISPQNSLGGQREEDLSWHREESLKQSSERQYTVGSLSDFAMECADRGRWEAAENIQAKVVQACRDALGRDHPDTLKSKARLAGIYSCQGRLWKAEELQREVVLKARELIGKNSLFTLETTNHLAIVLRELRGYREAERLYRRACDGFETTLGKMHSHTLEVLSDLALVVLVQERYDEAETLIKSVIVGREKALGKDHTSTLR